MVNPQDNKGHQTSPEQVPPSARNDEQFHFAQARQTIGSWPEWKRNIRWIPIKRLGDLG